VSSIAEMLRYAHFNAKTAGVTTLAWNMSRPA